MKKDFIILWFEKS